MITKRSISKPNSIEEFGEIAISKKKRSFSFSCSRPLSSSQTTTRHTIRPATQDRPPRMGIEPRHRKPVGWRSGSPKAYPYHSRTSRRDIQAHDLFHTSIPMRDRGTIPRTRGSHRTRNRVLKFSVERR